MSGLQMEPVISMGLEQEFANTKAKYNGKFHLDRMLVFRAEVESILDCVTSCLTKRWVKEQTTICIDSLVAVKSLSVADCIKKLTALLEVNQVTIIWVPGYSGIQ